MSSVVEYFEVQGESLSPTIFRLLWAELHSKKNPTQEWFESWLLRVPEFCGCQTSFREYLPTNPPRYDDWRRWSVEAHNWVNAKLGKPLWTDGG
jgi:hypothetical protein